MLKQNKYTFIDKDKKNIEVVSTMPVRSKKNDASKKPLKNELMEVFRKYGYLNEDIDYEVTFRTTSGNIAWISINSIETIK